MKRRDRLPGASLLATGLLGLMALATPGCGGQVPPAPQTAEVEFADADGPVPAQRSEDIIARLDGEAGASSSLRKHLAFEQAISSESPLMLGNKVTLLEDGPATHQAMFAAIRAARDHINLETYIFEDGEVGREISNLLLERQATGVQVNVIYDSVGGLMTPQSFFDRLREGGVQVLEFNPVNPLTENRKTWLLNNRDHRRQLVVDGRVAFVGGVNISDSYTSSPLGKRPGGRRDPTPDVDTGWRDTHVRIEGPAVAGFQKLFMNTWARQQGEPLAARQYFPDLQPAGNDIVRAIGSTASDAGSPIYLTLVSAIQRAELEVLLTVAYFGPDPMLLEALTDAARRGVAVKLVLPS